MKLRRLLVYLTGIIFVSSLMMGADIIYPRLELDPSPKLSGSLNANGKNVTGIKTLTAGNSNTQLTSLAPNTDLVETGCYDAISTGSPAFGSGNTIRSFISVCPKSRIRQDGTITQIKINFDSKPAAVTNFYFEIWRRNGSLWDRVTQQAIWSGASVGVNVITLGTPVAAKEGDYVGYSWTCSSEPVYFLSVTANTGTVATYIKENSAPSAIGNDWASGTNTSNSYLPIKTYMVAPMAVFIGDSITAGHGPAASHTSFIESGSYDEYANLTYPWQTGKALNWTYQNMGIGGQYSSQIAARFTTDAVNLKPRVVFIHCGVNDISTGLGDESPGAIVTAHNTFIASYTTMLNAAVANNIIPVVVLIAPWTAASSTKAALIDSWNADLVTLCASYPTAIVVDAKTYVGQFRVGGPAGNLWDQITAYDGGGAHYTPIGYTVLAQAVVDGTSKNSVRGGLDVSSIVSRGRISLVGNTPTKFLEVLRQQGYETPGTDLIVRSGGASILGTNHNGGDLYLSSGQSTGTGISNIYLQTAPAGSSGTADNAPATRLTLSPTNLTLDTSIGLVATGKATLSASSLNLASGVGLTITSGNVGINTTPYTTFDVRSPVDGLVNLANTDANAGLTIGHWTGFSFGYRGPTANTFNKVGIAYERTGAAAQGKIHFLSNSANDATNATLSDSVWTIDDSGHLVSGSDGTAAKNITTTGIVSAAGYGFPSATRNTPLGVNALATSVGATVYNIGVGYDAGKSISNGTNNISIGRASGGASATASVGTYNVSMGDAAGGSLTSGSDNTNLGKFAGWMNASGSGNVFVGAFAGYRQSNPASRFIVNNQDRFSDTAELTNSLIVGSFNATVSSQVVRVNGKFGATQIPIFANNAAAIAGGLQAGDLYRVNASVDPEPLYIVH